MVLDLSPPPLLLTYLEPQNGVTSRRVSASVKKLYISTKEPYTSPFLGLFSYKSVSCDIFGTSEVYQLSKSFCIRWKAISIHKRTPYIAICRRIISHLLHTYDLHRIHRWSRCDMRCDMTWSYHIYSIESFHEYQSLVQFLVPESCSTFRSCSSRSS